MNFLKKLFSSNKDEKSIKSESRLTNDNNDENIVGILKSEKDDRTLENNELIIEEEKKASKIEISEKINSNIKISDMEYFEERYAEVNLEEHRKIIDDNPLGVIK